MQDGALHLVAGEHVTQHGQRRARFHKLPFQLVMHKADLAFFRGADGLGIALALQGGDVGAGFFLPLALGACDRIAGLEIGKGDSPVWGARMMISRKGEALISSSKAEMLIMSCPLWLVSVARSLYFLPPWREKALFSRPASGPHVRSPHSQACFRSYARAADVRGTRS